MTHRVQNAEILGPCFKPLLPPS